MALDPLFLLREAVRAVPAVKYALGVAGLLAVVAIAKAFQLQPAAAVGGSIVTLVLMVALLIFARLSSTAPRHFLMPALVLTWGALILVLATAGLLFTAAFFGWPVELHMFGISGGGPDADKIARIVTSQLESRDYSSAWKTASSAAQQDPNSDALLEIQARVAEAWVRDMHIPDGREFAEVVAPLLPALHRAAERFQRGRDAQGAADALAHIGWANFLANRSGGHLEVEAKYRQALALDRDNVFAHAMLGHFLLVEHRPLAEAKEHFDSAVRSGREREFVRRFQLAGLQWSESTENSIELIRVCNDMRLQGESLPLGTRNRLVSSIYPRNPRELFARLDEILPKDAHLQTFRWLIAGVDPNDLGYQLIVLARLTEAAGDCVAAQQIYVTLLGMSGAQEEVRAGIERCGARAPQAGSELDALGAALKSPNKNARVRALDSLVVLVSEGRAGVDAAVERASPLLLDPDNYVRSEAMSTLARLGEDAAPAVIRLLRSSDPRVQEGAARALGGMEVPARDAVPPLLALLQDGTDDSVRDAALDALGSFGPKAAPVVPTLVQLLSKEKKLGRRMTLVYALGEIGPAAKPAVPLLVAALRDPVDREGFLRTNAAEALGKIGPGARSAIPALLAALDVDDPRIPSAAARALEAIGPEGKKALAAHAQASDTE